MRSKTNATHSESREAERSHRASLDKRGGAPGPAVPLALRRTVVLEQLKEERIGNILLRVVEAGGPPELLGGDAEAHAECAEAQAARARVARASGTARRARRRLRTELQSPMELLWTRLQPAEGEQHPRPMPGPCRPWLGAAATCDLQFRCE